jgi:chorismate mutase-like protein
MTQTNATPTEGTGLEEARAEIDQLDAELLDLVRRRLAVCDRIARHKKAEGISMMQQDRVEKVRARARDYAAEHGVDGAFLESLFELIVSEACRLEDAVIGGQYGRGLHMRALRIDHVAIAVPDLDRAIAVFHDRYGFSVLERRQVVGEISGMDSATLRAGGVTFVLCQGDSPKSNVSRYVEHYGPGVQHIALAVNNQSELLEDLRGLGADLLTGIIHAAGLDQSFTKRDPATGVQLEFVTRTENSGFDDNNVQELFTAMERENVY